MRKSLIVAATLVAMAALSACSMFHHNDATGATDASMSSSSSTSPSM